jgi:hypothetical protein
MLGTMITYRIGQIIAPVFSFLVDNSASGNNILYTK